jgi:hypothetical protein
MIKRGAFILTLGGSVLAASALTGIGGSASAGAASKHMHYAFANLTTQSVNIAQLSTQFPKDAKHIGNALAVYDNNADDSTTIANAKSMVNSDPDFIFEFSPDPAIGPALQAQFKAANIPCIGIIAPTGTCTYFALDQAAIGAAAAAPIITAAKAKGWNASNTTVVILQNAASGAVVNEVVTQFYASISGALPGFTKVSASSITPTTTTIGKNGLQLDGQAVADTSYTAMQQALPSIPSSNHIILFGITDDSVLGALRAIQSAGRGGTANLLVAGNGAGTNGLSQLRSNPVWISEGDTFTAQWGPYLMAMAAAVLAHAKVPAATYGPIGAITKATVNSYYAKNNLTVLKLPPLVKADNYLLKYNILQKFPGYPKVPAK